MTPNADYEGRRDAVVRQAVKIAEAELRNIEAGTPGIAGNIPVVARTVVYALADLFNVPNGSSETP